MSKSPGTALVWWHRSALGVIAGYIVLYTVFPLSCQTFAFWSYLQPFYKSISKPEIKDAMTAIFSVALLLVSLRYSGIFADFYKKLTAFGITDVRANRKGQDPAQTPMWLERISESPEVTIIGTKARGWFIKAKEELDHFLDANTKSIKTFAVYLLDPQGQTWRSLLRSDEQFRVFVSEVSFVLDGLQELRAKHECIQVFFYDSEPLHCVVARHEIYFAVVLPFSDAASYPELTISQGSFLGNKIYEEAIKKLQASAHSVSDEMLNNYRNFLKEHMLKSPDEYWKHTKPITNL